MKLDVQGQGGGRILDVDGQGGWGVLKIGQFSWTSYVYHPLYQNRSTISESVPLCRQLILHRQKVKTDVVYQIQLFHIHTKEVIYIFHSNENSFYVIILSE